MKMMPKIVEHGANLKLTRNPIFGSVSRCEAEVSKPPESPTFQDWHVTCKVTRAPSGVIPLSVSKRQHGGARNSGQRTSGALTSAQVGNIIAAAGYAWATGMHLTRMVTIHWEQAGVPLSEMGSATTRFLKLLGKALARHGCKSTYVWVHESGHGKGHHGHYLLHVPPELVPMLTRLQPRWVKEISGAKKIGAGVIKSLSIGRRLGIEHSNPELYMVNLEATVAYICKAAPQDVLDAHRVGRAHEPGGHIIGKRCGTSQNIGAKARALL
jgi:hypothetical protein